MVNDVPMWASPKRLARAVLARGVYPLARARALRDDPVTILMYHTIGRDEEDFDAWTVVRRGDFVRQMDFVRRHYDIVSLDDAVNGQASTAKRPRAVITFDDGEAGLYEHLLPIVDREALPVTVYVATGHIEQRQPYWFDRVMNALQTAAATTVDLRDVGLPAFEVARTRGPANWGAVSRVLQALKTLSPEQREVAARSICEQTERAGKRPVTPLAPLTRTQLASLAQSRWVTIGAHTHGHELLDQISLTEAGDTIERSRALLREWTSQPVTHFAYPNGNHNAELARLVEQLGFESAVTVRKGLWTRDASRYTAARVPVGRYDDMDKFKLDLIAFRSR